MAKLLRRVAQTHHYLRRKRKGKLHYKFSFEVAVQGATFEEGSSLLAHDGSSTETETERAMDKRMFMVLWKRGEKTAITGSSPLDTNSLKIEWNETLKMVCSLYRDKKTLAFEKKHAIFKLKEMMGSGMRRTLGQVNIDLLDYVHQTMALETPMLDVERAMSFPIYSRRKTQGYLMVTIKSHVLSHPKGDSSSSSSDDSSWASDESGSSDDEGSITKEEHVKVADSEQEVFSDDGEETVLQQVIKVPKISEDDCFWGLHNQIRLHEVETALEHVTHCVATLRSEKLEQQDIEASTDGEEMKLRFELEKVKEDNKILEKDNERAWVMVGDLNEQMAASAVGPSRIPSQSVEEIIRRDDRRDICTELLRVKEENLRLTEKLKARDKMLSEAIHARNVGAARLKVEQSAFRKKEEKACQREQEFRLARRKAEEEMSKMQMEKKVADRQIKAMREILSSITNDPATLAKLMLSEEVKASLSKSAQKRFSAISLNQEHANSSPDLHSNLPAVNEDEDDDIGDLPVGVVGLESRPISVPYRRPTMDQQNAPQGEETLQDQLRRTAFKLAKAEVEKAELQEENNGLKKQLQRVRTGKRAASIKMTAAEVNAVKYEEILQANEHEMSGLMEVKNMLAEEVATLTVKLEEAATRIAEMEGKKATPEMEGKQATPTASTQGRKKKTKL